MADFNKTLQQVVGYTSLVSGLLGNKGNTPLAHQESYRNFSDSVRAGIRKYGVQKPNMAHIVFDLPEALKRKTTSINFPFFIIF